MATLDDKLLGEKLQYYCSSSEDEGDDDEKVNAEPQCSGKVCEQNSQSAAQQEYREWDGISANTGPKGVIKDYQRFKQLERVRRAEEEIEYKELAKKFSITCRTTAEDEKALTEEEQIEAELGDLLSDEFMQKFVQQRMQEMLFRDSSLPSFGNVLHLKSGPEFLDAVDKVDAKVTVIVLLVEPNAAGCQIALKCVEELAREYPRVKFCTLRPSAVSMSTRFKVNGVPALLVYKGGQLVGNFVKITNCLESDFCKEDLENFLVEHGVIQDKSLVPELVSAIRSKDADASDED